MKSTVWSLDLDQQLVRMGDVQPILVELIKSIEKAAG
jgi:hypothetical protein